ncbi:hypothetical protein Pmani_019574 [Petrolisthes manimaculis]|uniref:Transmembrane and coiled-coil domain-containing protein 6 n=1 Tax=Petrolisthes manimaculis TaxID=1843537 RepID=A0AAE1PHE8_9EUCA|nr:hypothetical protein Pmani_019574 [Petrolisthes manimaculis]
MEYGEEEVVGSVGSIRQRARDDHQAFRVKKRSMARDGHRSGLQEVVKTLKAPSSQEFSMLCSALKKHKKVETLQRLRLGLGSNQDYIAIFLKCHGALYSLIGCLTGVNEVLQQEAACVLVNLSLGTEKQCREVCQRAGTYLVLHISSQNPNMQDPCAWCVGNLCGGHVSVCTLLLSQGGEEAMVKLLQSHSPHVLQSAAYALLHYLTTVPHRIEAAVEGGTVSGLLGAMNRVEEGRVAEVGWCLFLLSTHTPICILLTNHNVVGAAFTTLEKLINEQNLDVVTATSLVRVLMNCAAAAPGAAVQICYRSEQLVRIVKALLYCAYSHLRTETLHLLASVINAASSESETGRCLVADLSLRPRLESAVKSALAATFTHHTTHTSTQLIQFSSSQPDFTAMEQEPVEKHYQKSSS